MGETMVMILDGLPQYQTRVLYANTNSAFNLLKSKENACTGNKAKSPQRLAFSHPTQYPQSIYPGLRLYVKKTSRYFEKVKQLINNQQRLSISQTLSEIKDSKYGVVNGRSYTKQLDALISEEKWQRRFWSRSGDDMASGIINMLFADRVDFIFEYPNIFERYRPDNEAGAEIISFAIEESPPYILGYVLCSKTSEGLALAKKIDNVIKEISKAGQHFNSHLNWVSDSARQDMARYYNKVYGTNHPIPVDKPEADTKADIDR